MTYTSYTPLWYEIFLEDGTILWANIQNRTVGDEQETITRIYADNEEDWRKFVERRDSSAVARVRYMDDVFPIEDYLTKQELLSKFGQIYPLPLEKRALGTIKIFTPLNELPRDDDANTVEGSD